MLKRKSLSKKHTFWSMIDSNIKFWLILFSIILVVAAIPIVLGNVPYVYKLLSLLCCDIPKTVPVGFWLRYEAGFLAFATILIIILVSYFIVINFINLIWVLIAKTILSIRYTRLPLTEEEFNASFKGMDFLQVVNELTHYMSFRRINPWLEVIPITVSNHLTDDIYRKLFVLIFNKFKNETADYWKDIDGSSKKISNIIGWNIRCRMMSETSCPHCEEELRKSGFLDFLEHFNIFERPYEEYHYSN